jgi:hypothetical protein
MSRRGDVWQDGNPVEAMIDTEIENARFPAR